MSAVMIPEMARTQDTHPEMETGERLKFVREYLGFSQAEMAGKAGVSKTTYNNWETGLARISLDGARALKKSLGLTLEFIYYGETTAALDAMLSKAWMSRS